MHFISALKQNNVKNHPHTIIINYNKEFVKNLYEEPVTDTQIFGRSLMKAFTVAATYARQLYGVKYLIISTLLLMFNHYFITE